VEDLNPKCIAQCQEFSVEALQTPQVHPHPEQYPASHTVCQMKGVQLDERICHLLWHLLLQNGMTRGVSGSDLPLLALSDGEGNEAAAAPRDIGETSRRAGGSSGARTLMTFRGCTQRMVCTILLKVPKSTI
jgi:hypothetical protein